MGGDPSSHFTALEGVHLCASAIGHRPESQSRTCHSSVVRGPSKVATGVTVVDWAIEAEPADFANAFRSSAVRNFLPLFGTTP